MAGGEKEEVRKCFRMHLKQMISLSGEVAGGHLLTTWSFLIDIRFVLHGFLLEPVRAVGEGRTPP